MQTGYLSICFDLTKSAVFKHLLLQCSTALELLCSTRTLSPVKADYLCTPLLLFGNLRSEPGIRVNMHPSWMQMMRPFVSAHLLALVINVGNSANGNTACRLHLDEPTDLQIGGGISEWMGKLRGIQDSFKVPRTPLSSHPPLATWGRLKPRSFGRLVNLAISGHCGWQRRMQENRKTGSRLRQSVSTPVAKCSFDGSCHFVLLYSSLASFQLTPAIQSLLLATARFHTLKQIIIFDSALENVFRLHRFMVWKSHSTF